MRNNRTSKLAKRSASVALACLIGVSCLLPATVLADTDPSPVRVNQVGYLPGADKIATIVSPASSPLKWELRSDSGTIAAEGLTRVFGIDRASGDHVHQADFSSVTVKGRYKLRVTGMGDSVSFDITGSLYPDLPAEAMEYFYFHRMGVDIEGRYLSNPAFAHKSLHPGDESVGCFNNWCQGERLNVRYSWADAGDFGIYPVNQAISAWTLLNLYERYPHVFPDGSLLIPESGNGIPDLIDEVAFGSTFMKGVMPASGGLASHKIHNDSWSAFPVVSIDQENAMSRQAQPPSTNATYAVARNLAHLARVLEPFNREEASRLWTTAKEAWRRAAANPTVLYSSQTSDTEGGGDYADKSTSDDRYAAAAELYLTAYQLKDGDLAAYRSAVTSSPHYREIGHVDWAAVAAAGTLSLLSGASDLPQQDIEAMEAGVRRYADGILADLRQEGYPSPLPGGEKYPWGSNSFVVNKMIMLAFAYDATLNLDYLKGMYRIMDYLMGNNAMRLSYITGYGEYYETDLHDRWAWGKYTNGIPFPRGWLSGGPNNELINDPATPAGKPAAKSYAAKNTAPDAWGSKENTINWNAPLVWVAQYLQDHKGDLDNAGGEEPVPEVPGVPSGVTAGSADGAVLLSWKPAAGAVAYKVKRALVSGGPYAEIAAVTSTGYKDQEVVKGTTYYYVITAVNAAGESGSSEQVTAKPADDGGGTPPPESGLAVEYRAGDTNAGDNQFKPQFRIVNKGTAPVALSGLTIRYYFTADGDVPQTFNCDWAAADCANLVGTISKLPESRQGADHMLEISFKSQAGSIPAGGTSGEIQTRNHKSNWTSYNEADDYSYDPGKSSFAEWDRVTLYRDGTLVWGIEP
ncbi:glycoside hydrolase family 9 protein [Paenibacillus tarimensis]|uniref:glycoside hydrolase family 9 protein n=1 Tax=Paenibacillus tarimensis TaxID=416012 RepID=UPI001F376F28|nr:glycoside hydrolase family 9 protein [Paenibacillus tarimensis]MCF2944656.1 glycoside hydrolase family 9 protein [Paenibacillus tarimensis]